MIKQSLLNSTGFEALNILHFLGHNVSINEKTGNILGTNLDPVQFYLLIETNTNNKHWRERFLANDINPDRIGKPGFDPESHFKLMTAVFGEGHHPNDESEDFHPRHQKQKN